MAFGSFLSGLAGGVSTGENIKHRKEMRGVLENMNKGDGGDGNEPRSRGVIDQNRYQTSDGQERPRARGIVPQDQRELLALTLDAEAGGEGYDGMLAAGSVIANRAKTDGYGGDISEVIMKPGQFSAWNSVTGYANGEGGLDMASRNPSKDAYAVADSILSGKYEDPTGGATHYYNPSVANPKWGRDAGGNWERIGNHVFGNADAGRRREPSAKAKAQTQAQPAEAKKTPAVSPLVASARGVISAGQKIIDTFY